MKLKTGEELLDLIRVNKHIVQANILLFNTGVDEIAKVKNFSEIFLEGLGIDIDVVKILYRELKESGADLFVYNTRFKLSYGELLKDFNFFENYLDFSYLVQYLIDRASRGEPKLLDALKIAMIMERYYGDLEEMLYFMNNFNKNHNLPPPIPEHAKRRGNEI